MYQSILDGIFWAKNIPTHDVLRKQQYLNSLQNHVRTIRAAYRNFPVRFDYTDIDIQAAYLLTYLPHYTDFLWKVLSIEGNRIANEMPDQLIFIGSGPCPEIIGYLRYLNQHPLNRHQYEINVSIYDIAIEDWRWSRDIVFGHVVPNYTRNGCTVNRRAGNIDISNGFNLNITGNKILCVFQNCLNEIPQSRHNILHENVVRLFNSLPTDSYIALIDLDYREVRSLLISIESSLDGLVNCEIVRSVNNGQIDHRTTQDNEPPIIRQYLLTDTIGNNAPATGLLPKRRLPFMYTLIKKTENYTVNNYLFDNNNYDVDLPF